MTATHTVKLTAMAPIHVGLPAATDGQALAAFLAALALMNQPRTHLMDLYRGWMDILEQHGIKHVRSL